MSYMSKRVQVVIGELEFVERHQLPHPVESCARRIGVDVQSA